MGRYNKKGQEETAPAPTYRWGLNRNISGVTGAGVGGMTVKMKAEKHVGEEALLH